MKRIFLTAAAAFLVLSGNKAFAQARTIAQKPTTQYYTWQSDDVYGDRDDDDDDRDDDDRHKMKYRDQRYGYEQRHQDKHRHGYRKASYVKRHPIYRRILAARLPIQEGRRVEKELFRIRQMEARYAYNGRLGARERAVLDRELVRLEQRVARFYPRDYAWR